MSGAVAAHAAYNGSGTQGLAVTNKIHDDDGDVMSVFWNKSDTTRQLLYGSAFVEVPASGGSGTSFISTTNSVIFDVNNDIDCLGDMYLKILYTCAGAAQTRPWAPQQLALSIGRVEIMVGTQIWQTLEQADLLALLSTELSSGSHSDFSFQATGGVGLDGQYINGFPTATLAGPTGANKTTEQILYIPLKMLTKTLTSRLENFAEQSEDGYLMAAAPHQQVKVKVFTAKFTDNSSTQSTIKLSLYAKNQVMCNEEREQIKAMPMGLPKRIKMTQNKFLSVPTSGKTMDIDLDHFSLYASHIIISSPVKPPSYTGVSTADAFPLTATFTPTYDTGEITAIAVANAGRGYPANSEVTLKITSAEGGGSGAVATTTTDANGSFTNAVTISGTQTSNYTSSTTTITVPSDFKNDDRTTQLQPVNLGTAELLLNSSSYSGKLPLGLLKQTGPSMGLYTNEYWVNGANHSAYITYVFPLASRAYGGSSVPLNRFDNIRLKLTFPTDISKFTQTSENINITCVGETTALYKGGAASLAMY